MRKPDQTAQISVQSPLSYHKGLQFSIESEVNLRVKRRRIRDKNAEALHPRVRVLFLFLFKDNSVYYASPHSFLHSSGVKVGSCSGSGKGVSRQKRYFTADKRPPAFPFPNKPSTHPSITSYCPKSRIRGVAVWSVGESMWPSSWMGHQSIRRVSSVVSVAWMM